jgi:3-isopropylmalate/(R)-2-methylmalate dehydratase small subunit
VWALIEYGFRAILAPSFSPIFRMNCVRNGIVPVCLPDATIAALARSVAIAPQVRRVTVDLVRQVVSGPDGAEHAFVIDPESREMLLEGLDAIDLTLKQRGAIEAFTEADHALRPWIYVLQ